MYRILLIFNLAMLLWFSAMGCRCPQRDPLQSQWQRFEFTERQMGVLVRMILYAPDAATAEKAAQAGFARLQELNQILSDYETDSELNQLSFRSGRGIPVRVSSDLWRVLQRAQALAKETDGAFDITIGPYSGLWRKARRQHRLPDEARLNTARQRVGYQKLILDPTNHTARLLVKNMRLDLGGIAKGYSLDSVLQRLRQYGVSSALVSGGGDIVVGDAPPDRPGWRIELAPLNVTRAPAPRYVTLVHAALATSGDVFQHLEIGGRRFSHIVDPRTGLGLTNHTLVHVIAPNGLTADSLATTLSVLGPEAGMPLIEARPSTAALLTRSSNGTLETMASKRFSHWETQ